TAKRKSYKRMKIQCVVLRADGNNKKRNAGWNSCFSLFLYCRKVYILVDTKVRICYDESV
uniref:hypothetical protein n=1 Tax=Candidatus Ventrimonas sp. TaxID=3048889 RepID=UPI003FF14E3C